jgi:lysophospholipase L1-like esterase
VSPRFAVHKYGVLTHNYWRAMAGADGAGGKVVARLLSDHYPVVAELELPRLRAPQDWAQYGVYDKSNAEVKKAKVVFMGNSITWNWKRFHPEFFSENEGYVCRGISGQVTAQMLARFRADVINLRPEKVVILAGTNDIAMNQGYVSLDHIFENIVSMAELARFNKINVVLCSVLPTDRYNWSWEISTEKAIKSIQELNEKLKAYADREGIPYADFYTKMADTNQALIKDYQQDPVHPNLAGYRVMEEIIEKILK